jgi:PIN domain nuclease of toxin-antitoxin system
VTVLDAYAVIAFLRGEPAADAVRSIFATGRAEVTAVGLAEVLDHLVRLAGAAEDEAVLDLAQLGLLDATPVSPGIGSAAGRLRARHYPHPLPGQHGGLHRRGDSAGHRSPARDR